MKNISRKNDEVWLTFFFSPDDCTIVLGEAGPKKNEGDYKNQIGFYSPTALGFYSPPALVFIAPLRWFV